MRIAIIGAGDVGRTLGRGWINSGHEVVFGVRDTLSPKAARLVEDLGTNAEIKKTTEAASSGEVVVLATPWGATRDAIESAGNLSGKVVLDCTNPLKPDFSGLELGFTTSGGEQVARWAEGARVVKIFNTTGFNNMADPAYPEGRAAMFYCGDQDEAKDIARQLASDLGFDPIDAGQLKQSRLLEPLALLWINLAFQGHGRDIAFRLMRR